MCYNGRDISSNKELECSAENISPILSHIEARSPAKMLHYSYSALS